ncbi:hypothetical protein FMM58_01655 [Campylobacter sp. LR291e]|uniref:hypothetical protein n=1 Tax=Campylobacter sp. LR291e TaxID=2593546 RepID=UPI00123BBD1A|nr:hypothetical protein [Campylobacter sp. LR291e]KAA6233650.1 hypothetical protein FMM58_01655 [Campylobacter sp. LR291e]
MRKTQVYDSVNLNFGYIIAGLFLIFYEIISSVFVYFPILYGVFFYYMFKLLEEREYNVSSLDFRWYFSLFFLAFCDITHSFFIFSSWLAFLIFYIACAEWVQTNLKVGKLTAPILVLISYALIFLIDYIFSYVIDQHFKILSYETPITILIEALIAFIFFKDKF